MPVRAQAGERYTIRKKLFKIFGGAFYILDPEGKTVGYCEQKAFRLREALTIYTGTDKATELLRIGTGEVLDFGATYQVMAPSGEVLGQLRRKGLKSTMLRDEWLVLDEGGAEIGTIQEENATLAFLRKWVDMVSLLFPQKFVMTDRGGRTIATFRQHFNLISYRLGVAIVADDDRFDDLFVLAVACLIAVVEGRQDS